MENNRNYTVSYTIDVQAPGIKTVQQFAESMKGLAAVKTNFNTAVENIRTFMKDIESAFRTQKGRKKDQTYKLNIDTKGTEAKLERVKVLLGEVKELTKGIHLVINAGSSLNTNRIKAETRRLVNQKTLQNQQTVLHNSAQKSVKTFMDAQANITRSVGKINAALKTLEKERKVNINTDTARQRLNELLTLVTRINQSSMTMRTPVVPNGLPGKWNGLQYAPMRPNMPLPDKMQQKLFYQQQQDAFRNQQRAQLESMRHQQRLQLEQLRQQQRLQDRIFRQQDDARKKQLAQQQRREKEARQQQQRNAAERLRMMQRQSSMQSSMMGSRQRAAINRLQYSKAPSLRNMPFAYMFNAYMGYSLMRRQLTQAVEYANIMESAHSILKVADNDLSTFETRFDHMAKYVRQIGVETKFTAIEVAGAVKYLSMAGMGIGTIMESIRPITNLALIGDNDISQIADLATNIMAGYNIKNTSMPSVADILANTVSRSNVNIIEVAESYKMAAGYLKLSGVEFSEATAAIGILGNMGVKGTMAGTALRAMSTRFAKPTKESRRAMEKLGIKFTYYDNIYGKEVEKLRPLADIFQELKEKGATMVDMQAIFGKIGGNAAMMFLNNADKLRTLTSQNATSHGISGELAKVKQDTTKGLWFQVTSQFSESFMQAFEVLEPQIKRILKSFLERFKAPEFAKGLQSIGRVLLDILSILGNFASWFTRNFHWLEPLLFTGLVATRLFRFAAALTNIGVAIGFIGKQSAGTSTISLLANLTGAGGIAGARNLKNLTMANKRAIVTALQAAGISGRGAMSRYLMQPGMLGGGLMRGGAAGLFASQVATGNGLIGAGASIAALGKGALFATAGVTALIGALGWVAYKTWKVKQAKDAVQEEIETNKNYHYPSIDALYDSLKKTYDQALSTKKAVDDVTEGKKLEEASGQKIGAFTGNWWSAFLGQMGRAASCRYSAGQGIEWYGFDDAYQDDARAAIETVAKLHGQNSLNAAWGKLGEFKTAMEVSAFMQTIEERYGLSEDKLDKSLWYTDSKGKISYHKGIDKLTDVEVSKTYHYAKVQNEKFVPMIKVAAQAYGNAISGFEGAKDLISKTGFNFNRLEELGFYRNEKGFWVQPELGKDAGKEDRIKQMGDRMKLHDLLVKLTASLRNTLGGNAEAAENVLRTAGFTRSLYSNEPDSADEQPFDANRITNDYSGVDDGRAGGNYSGTGKLSSAAPKQVIVNIANLLSVQTIELLQSPQGKQQGIQNLKEELAQALIDVVHDFDASWNG